MNLFRLLFWQPLFISLFSYNYQHKKVLTCICILVLTDFISSSFSTIFMSFKNLALALTFDTTKAP